MANNVREILTLQVGRYSNYVGAHYWNFQDELFLYSQQQMGSGCDYSSTELEPAITFKSVRTEAGQQVLTPRVLIFDTRDALGTLHPLGTLHKSSAQAEAAAGATWGQHTSVHRQRKPKANEFLQYLEQEDGEGALEEVSEAPTQTAVEPPSKRLRRHPFGLDDSVRTWADYLKCHTSSRTIQQLPFRDGGAEFDHFGAGGSDPATSAIPSEAREAYSDALRMELEECDAVQGINTMGDLQGGYCGLAHSLMAEMKDECPGSPVTLFCMSRIKHDTSRRDDVRSGVTLALSLVHFLETCTAVCFLDEAAAGRASPHLAVDPRKPYPTSAVLAAAVDTATSPFRLNPREGARWSCRDWCQAITGTGSSQPPPCGLTSLRLCFPFPHPSADKLRLRGLLGLQPRGSGSGPASDGVLSDWLVPMSLAPSPQPGGSSGEAEAGGVSYQAYMTRGLHATSAAQAELFAEAGTHSGMRMRAGWSGYTPLPVPLSFPLILRASLDEAGEVLGGAAAASAHPQDRLMCDELAALTTMGSGPELLHLVQRAADALDLRSAHVQLELQQNGLQVDDAAETKETLLDLVYRYSEMEL